MKITNFPDLVHFLSITGTL